MISVFIIPKITLNYRPITNHLPFRYNLSFIMLSLTFKNHWFDYFSSWRL